MMFTVVVPIAAVILLVLIIGIGRKVTHFRAAGVTDLETLFDKGPDIYASIHRILGPGDFEFLASSRYGPAFLPRLRRQRVKLMKVVVAQMRDEFDSLVTIGALFATAPTAQAEDFAGRLQRNRIRFYFNVSRLYVRIWVNHFFLWPVEILPLTGQIEEVRAQAGRILHALTPGDLGALRTHLRAQ